MTGTAIREATQSKKQSAPDVLHLEEQAVGVAVRWKGVRWSPCDECTPTTTRRTASVGSSQRAHKVKASTQSASSNLRGAQPPELQCPVSYEHLPPFPPCFFTRQACQSDQARQGCSLSTRHPMLTVPPNTLLNVNRVSLVSKVSHVAFLSLFRA
eukprot:scaffold224568_cov17-Tisochrysis_lutea.AAC.2